jgi:NADH dehydrogenase FAD-containing subunit
LREPHVVIVGAGFGGLAAAKALKRAPVTVSLIDRSNHHLFQPLLYQVATAALSPGHIASPIRGLLRHQRNANVLLADVTAVDTMRKCLTATTPHHALSISYDYLLLATGVQHSYFGHDEFAPFAPGLKSLADAVLVRNKILHALESAEADNDPDRQRELLTFVLVGAGPTGVEMAGAIAMLIAQTSAEYRHIDARAPQVILVDRDRRILPTFSSSLSTAAHERLTALGVRIRLGHAVDHVDAYGVEIGGERIPSRTVIWTAGVEPSPVGRWLGASTDRAGRVKVQSDLTVPGNPDLFVIGDAAAFEQDGHPLPGVAQVAMQQGRHAARVIQHRLAVGTEPGPFRYFDKGSMAMVGKNFALMQSSRIRLTGLPAYLAWGVVHLEFLAHSSLKLSVLVQWLWSYTTNQSGARLIVRHHEHASGPRTSRLEEKTAV